MAAERENRDWSQIPDGLSEDHFAAQAEKVPRVTEPRSVRGEVSISEAVPKFSFVIFGSCAAPGEHMGSKGS